MHIHPLITDTASLEKLCERLARSDFVAVDTEFMRENTYWPDLCLIQVGERGGSGGDRSQGGGDRPHPAAQPARQQRACAQGLPRRRPGYRDRLQPDRRHPASPVRHPDRGDGARARRAGRLFEPGREPARPQPRQGRALHRLGAPAARQAPDRLCDRRRHPSRRAVPADARAAASGPGAAPGSTRRWSGSPTRPITSTIRRSPGSGSRSRPASPTRSAG